MYEFPTLYNITPYSLLNAHKGELSLKISKYLPLTNAQLQCGTIVYLLVPFVPLTFKNPNFFATGTQELSYA